MKNLLLIFTHLVMSKNDFSRRIAVSIMNRLRFVSVVLVCSLLSLIFIGSALNMIVSDLLTETASQQQLAMTSISAIGFGIIICSLTAICLFFRKSVWGLA